MKTKACLIAVTSVAALAILNVTVWAQVPAGGARPPGGGAEGVMFVQGRLNPRPGCPACICETDPMGENFFPPELIMQNQKAIGLKDDQQKAIRAEMQKVTAKVTDLQWDLTSAQQEMMSLAKEGKVDEKQTLAQLDKLLAVENEIKRLQMGLLIKVKNVLMAEQQNKLRELRQPFFPMPIPMGGMGTGVAVPMTMPAPAPGGVVAPMPAREEPKR